MKHFQINACFFFLTMQQRLDEETIWVRAKKAGFASFANDILQIIFALEHVTGNKISLHDETNARLFQTVYAIFT